MVSVSCLLSSRDYLWSCPFSRPIYRNRPIDPINPVNPGAATAFIPFYNIIYRNYFGTRNSLFVWRPLAIIIYYVQSVRRINLERSKLASVSASPPDILHGLYRPDIVSPRTTHAIRVSARWFVCTRSRSVCQLYLHNNNIRRVYNDGHIIYICTVPVAHYSRSPTRAHGYCKWEYWPNRKSTGEKWTKGNYLPSVSRTSQWLIIYFPYSLTFRHVSRDPQNCKSFILYPTVQ